MIILHSHFVATEFKIWIRENIPKPENNIKFLAITPNLVLRAYTSKPTWNNKLDCWCKTNYISVHIVEANKFLGLSECWSVDEIYNLEEEKMNEKYTFVREITSIPEVLIALGEGFILTTYKYVYDSGYMLKDNKIIGIHNKLMIYELSDIVSEFNKFPKLYAQTREQTQWYHNIPPQGILCQVWDGPDSKTEIDIITNYISDPDGFVFINNRGWKWYHATPITLEEVMPFIHSEN